MAAINPREVGFSAQDFNKRDEIVHGKDAFGFSYFPRELITEEMCKAAVFGAKKALRRDDFLDKDPVK